MVCNFWANDGGWVYPQDQNTIENDLEADNDTYIPDFGVAEVGLMEAYCVKPDQILNGDKLHGDQCWESSECWSGDCEVIDCTWDYMWTRRSWKLWRLPFVLYDCYN